MSFSSNDTMRPLALQRSHSLPHLTNSREDSGVALSASGSCSGLNNLGYGSDVGSSGRRHRHHHHHHRHHDLKIPYGARLVADLRQLITLKQHYYPEGGWGWLVTYIGILINCIAHGLQLSAGVFLLQTAHIFPHLTVAAALRMQSVGTITTLIDLGSPWGVCLIGKLKHHLCAPLR
uniref:Monocarboxylate transporter n=1 Tax=Anopheles maculatus TaxID=74869 RepID=A0A182SEC1_9DIPT